MKPVVFIHTNAKQLLGAKVSEHSLRRNSSRPDSFEVRYINVEEQPALHNRHGQGYLRKGKLITWDNEDLQSFTPTRFLAPQLMNYEGRSLVIDPDVFAVGDVWELLSRDMQGKAVVCRQVSPADGRPPYYATSVMLLDCAKLRHWDWERDIQRMFDRQLDYYDWMNLYTEPAETIGSLEEEWNHFDILNERTKLLHNTGRMTQPWKTGLTIDFVAHDKGPAQPPAAPKLLGVIPRWWAAQPKHEPKAAGVYQPHPDKRQEEFFFGLVRECLEQGIIDEEFVRREMDQGHVRRDALEVVEALSPAAAR